MKLLLLQDHLYLPSLGGGIKANRLLLEALALRGHRCVVVSPALTTRAGPTDMASFQEQMAGRGIAIRTPEPFCFAYDYHGVQVDATCFPDAAASRDYAARRIREFEPDCVLVNDDKHRILWETALVEAPDRVVLVLQTIVNLPFGPLAARPSPAQTDLMRRARAIVVISNSLRNYLRQHAGLESCRMSLPVYGEGPFPLSARFDRGCVTLINPCLEKGLEIFLALAAGFPAIEFAAVPTWGADEAVYRALAEAPNVQILPPSDDVETIYAQTRVLLAPSLWPETFGYVAPEAMLRGIPVLASDIGGLPEAKLGVDYLLPVAPAQRSAQGYVSPPQDVAPWAAALRALLTDAEAYERCSRASREAATAFVSGIRIEDFEALFAGGPTA